MGWTSSDHWGTRKEAFDGFLSDLNFDRFKVVAKCLRGSTGWVVVKPTTPSKHNPDAHALIVCVLVGKCGENFGYKDMTESMQPYFYSCPQKYLDLAPEENAEWRAKVGEYHARRTRRFAVGEKVTLESGYNPDVLTVAGLKPLVGYSESGRLFRIPRKAVVRVESN